MLNLKVRRGAWAAAIIGVGSFSGASIAFGQEAPSAFVLIDPLPGNAQSELVGISEDGTIAVGNSVNPVQKAFTLSPADPANTVMDIGVPDPTSFRASATLTSISRDGSTIIGQGSHKLSEQFQINEAARWTESGDWTFLGTLYQEDSTGGSIANGVSSDGRFIVGSSTVRMQNSNQLTEAAFLWTESGGMVELVSLPSGEQTPTSNAAGVNADGGIIVGTSTIDRAPGPASIGNLRPVFWTAPNEIHQLPLLLGENDIGDDEFFLSSAGLVSDDGNTIVGSSPLPGGPIEISEGVFLRPTNVVRWHRMSPGSTDFSIEDLGAVSDDQKFALPSAMNADASVIVGVYTEGLEGNLFGFRWTEETGMQDIFTWLADSGVEVASDNFSTIFPKGVNEDGSIIVGQVIIEDEGQQLLGFIATGEGLILPSKVLTDIAGLAGAFDAVSIGSLLQHGAHGNPMIRRVAAGRSAFWAAGDIGRDNHGKRDGDVSLAEIGYARNFGDVQLNLSVGKNWADQSMRFNGSVDAEGTFVTAEVIVPVKGYNNLFATLGGFGQWGDLDVRRGYLNGGVPATARANPDTNGWGLRARLDAVDAYQNGETLFTPYVDLAYQRVTIDAFTDKAIFPATFHKRNDKRFSGRLGLNAVHPLNEKLSLTANGEVAHDFDNDGGRTSGHVAGLFSFNFVNNDLNETWAKGGVGIKADVEGGTFTLNANATTEGSMPSGWLAASYMIGL